jgi:hypothetical protein
MKVAGGELIGLVEGSTVLLKGPTGLLGRLVGIFEGLISLPKRLVIFFGEVRGQDSNVLSMYRDEPDLCQ